MGLSCRAPTAVRSAAAGSSTPCACRAGADRDSVAADLAQRGVQAKAYMPSIHLMDHYRERFGYKRRALPGRRGRLRPPALAAVLPLR